MQAIRVEVRDVDGNLSTHAFLKESVVVGRSAECDLVVPDPYVSRQHLRIFWSTPELVECENLSRANPTRHNSVPFTRTHLGSGDTLELGQVGLRIEFVPAETCEELVREETGESTVPVIQALAPPMSAGGRGRVARLSAEDAQPDRRPGGAFSGASQDFKPMSPVAASRDETRLQPNQPPPNFPGVVNPAPAVRPAPDPDRWGARGAGTSSQASSGPSGGARTLPRIVAVVAGIVALVILLLPASQPTTRSGQAADGASGGALQGLPALERRVTPKLLNVPEVTLLSDGRRALELARIFISERDIKAESLYLAGEQLRIAETLLDHCRTPTRELEEVRQTSKRVNRELDERFADDRLKLSQARIARDRQECARIIERMLKMIPNPADPRYQYAQTELRKLNEAIARGKAKEDSK